MTISHIIMLSVAGFAAGVFNAIAGGGTFISFAALAATGMTTLDANATSAVALTPANLASAAAYRSEIRTHARDIFPFAIMGVVGGVVGALLLIWLGDKGFRPLVPWLLLMATILFAFSSQIRNLLEPLSHGKQAIASGASYAIMFIVTIYGGFFGAGAGIIMLAGLSIITSGDYHKSNATKVLVGSIIQVFSAALVIAAGLVHWPAAIVTTIAASLGGYLGVGWARRIPEKIVRAVVVTIGAALTLVFFLK